MQTTKNYAELRSIHRFIFLLFDNFFHASKFLETHNNFKWNWFETCDENTTMARSAKNSY